MGEDVKERFNSKKATEGSIIQMEELRDLSKKLAIAIDNIPNCREKAIALTKLEETSMWANKATILTQIG